MVVRLRLKIKGPKQEAIETSGIANAGYESRVPEAAVPSKLARKLGLKPKMKGSRRERYRAASGTFSVTRYPRSLEVEVLTEDRSVKCIADAIVIKGLDEVLLSDQSLSRLGIVILDAARGLWRFADDSLDRVRESV